MSMTKGRFYVEGDKEFEFEAPASVAGMWAGGILALLAG
jgi:hypothetical protein